MAQKDVEPDPTSSTSDQGGAKIEALESPRWAEEAKPDGTSNGHDPGTAPPRADQRNSNRSSSTLKLRGSMRMIEADGTFPPASEKPAVHNSSPHKKRIFSLRRRKILAETCYQRIGTTGGNAMAIGKQFAELSRHCVRPQHAERLMLAAIPRLVTWSPRISAGARL